VNSINKRPPFDITNSVSNFPRAIASFIKQYQLNKVCAYLDELIVAAETTEGHDLNLKLLLDTATDCNLTLNEDKSKLCVTSLRMLGLGI